MSELWRCQHLQGPHASTSAMLRHCPDQCAALYSWRHTEGFLWTACRMHSKESEIGHDASLTCYRTGVLVQEGPAKQ